MLFKRNHLAAFTLIELMISVVIVLILMLGINFVFSTSAKTVSTGMALSSIGRELRGARRVFENDFVNAKNLGEDMPAIVIHSEEIYAFRDKQDQLTDYDYNAGDTPANRLHQTATYDADGNAANGDEEDLTVAGPAGYPGNYNHRRHRIDRISFFARSAASEYTRQTGDANTFVGTETSPDAWISYGMLRLPDNQAVPLYWKPGVGTQISNPTNFYSSQWIFGRHLMLMCDTSKFKVGTTYTAANYLQYNALVGRVTAVNPLAGGAFNRENPPYPSSSQWQIFESRCDAAACTLDTFKTYMQGQTSSGATYYTDADANRDSARFDNGGGGSPAPGNTATLNYLFWANPYINKQNFATSIANQTREAALISPIFLRGCSQVIVEFAGDFYDQGAIGGVAEAAGTVDYTAGGGVPPTSRIHWYGMPRDMDGDGVISVAAGSSDVNTIAAGPGNGIGLGTPTPRWSSGTVEQVAAPGAPRIWAWGNSTTAGDANKIKPTLIRITFELTDANGRLPDGQRMELIYALK